MNNFNLSIGLFIISQLAICSLALKSVAEFFPGQKELLFNLGWKSVISENDIEIAFNDKRTHILKANLIKNSESNDVMLASGPTTPSNLTLDYFLTNITQGEKGFSLHYDNMNVIALSETIINKHLSNISVPMFLSADVAAINTSNIVNNSPETFINFAKKFDGCILLLGWNTKNGTDDTIKKTDTKHYDQDLFKKMDQVLEKVPNTTSVSFSIRIGMATKSNITELVEFVNKRNDSTVYLWDQQGDFFDEKIISELIKTVGYDRVFTDLSSTILKKLDLPSSAPSARASIVMSLLTFAIGYLLLKV